MKFFVSIPKVNVRALIPSLVQSVLALGVECITLVIDGGSDRKLNSNRFLGSCERYFKSLYNVGLAVPRNIALDYGHQMK